MRVWILLSLCLGAAFAVPKNPERIMGGDPTSIEQFPFMANMQYGLLGILWSHACGGSLLSNYIILSAAHCYVGDHPFFWRAILGSASSSSSGNRHMIFRIILHPQFSDVTLENDVAIVDLMTPAFPSATVGFARIPGPGYNPADGSVVTALGWGALWNDGPASARLQKVELNIVNQDLCAARYKQLKTLSSYQNLPDVTEGMLCAGILDMGGKGVCHGDSGGPLVHQSDVILGVNSWHFGCGDGTYPGVSTRVSYYSDWIVASA